VKLPGRRTLLVRAICTFSAVGARLRTARFGAGAVAAAAAVRTVAQPAAKVPRIGTLAPGSPGSFPHLREAFRQGLRDHGYVEGRNIVIEDRFAEGSVERLAELAAELVRLQVDVIVATPTVSAVAARKATASIPIVAVSVADPVRLGLAASLARPGGNVTGMAFSVGFESITKGLQVLKEALPAARRVAVLSNASNPSQPLAVGDLATAGRSLDLELQLLEVRGPDDFDAAFAAMARQRAAALLVVADTMFIRQRARLAELAAKYRLPSMHGVRENVEAGGLLAFGPSLTAQQRRAAAYVDKILRGAKPGDLPIEQPRQFELVINLRTAKTLGIAMSQSLLLRADEVIE
jgi:putative ABC transport system substrate-binding protein